jgi:hypothetical protein
MILHFDAKGNCFTVGYGEIIFAAVATAAALNPK